MTVRDAVLVANTRDAGLTITVGESGLVITTREASARAGEVRRDRYQFKCRLRCRLYLFRYWQCGGGKLHPNRHR